MAKRPFGRRQRFTSSALMSQVFISVLYLPISMTDSTIQSTAVLEEDIALETEVAEVPNPGASYDPTGNAELDGLREELNSRRWDEGWISHQFAPLLERRVSLFTCSLSLWKLTKHSR